MNGGKVVHVVQRPCSDHSAGAARTLFGRLEDQFDGAVELGFMLLKHLRQPQTNGGVAVMRAGVHHARVTGGKTVAVRPVAVVMRFAQIKRIHVHAKGQRRAGATGIQGRDNAGEPAFERREPFFRCALRAGAGKFLRGVASSGNPIRLSASTTSRPIASS